jgi:hypothetical protein
MRELAPIVLFVYNRPWHTQKMLEALSKNNLVSQSQIYVYCDGPKTNASDADITSIKEVRDLIKRIDWCEKVQIIESLVNKGLANSIIEGVTAVVNRHGKIIVLEDDIVTSVGFIEFMNDALDFYSGDQEVMHVSGYMYPVNGNLPATFFTKATTCWGWGTWADSWACFERNVEEQIKRMNKGVNWKEFTYDYAEIGFKNQLFDNGVGKIDTWAIFWYASVFLKGGTSLHPYPSLVQNIGNDGSGVHCNDLNSNNPYFWNKLAERIEVKNTVSKNDKGVYKKIVTYFNFLNSKKETFNLRDKFYLFRKSLIHKFKK